MAITRRLSRYSHAIRGMAGSIAPAPRRPACRPQGNTAGQQQAWLYRLETSGGQLLKWGISQNPRARYSPAWLKGKRLRPLLQGPRASMLQIERILVETQPGPLNRERWRASINPPGCKFPRK